MTATLPPTIFSQDYQRILQMLIGYRSAKVLMAASWHGIFTILAEGPQTSEAVARQAGLDRRATTILLDALTALEFLDKNHNVYSNRPVADQYLVKGRPHDLGHNIKFQELIWDAWSDLRHVLEKGKPDHDLRHWISQEPEFVPEYIRGMKNIATTPATELSRRLPLAHLRSMLDVGAGPGAYSRIFLESAPQLHATLLDLPETLRITKEELSSLPIYSRVRLQEGDYHTAPFGESAYDLILMSHITHDEGPAANQALFRKAFQALTPGGLLVVHDFMTEDDGAPLPFPALFAVHMLVYTREGQVYPKADYVRWFENSGFSDIAEFMICEGSSNATMALVGKRRPIL